MFLQNLGFKTLLVLQSQAVMYPRSKSLSKCCDVFCDCQFLLYCHFAKWEEIIFSSYSCSDWPSINTNLIAILEK